MAGREEKMTFEIGKRIGAETHSKITLSLDLPKRFLGTGGKSKCEIVKVIAKPPRAKVRILP